MIGDYVRSLEGIAALGIAGLLASMAFFMVILIRALRIPASHADALARLPFDDCPPGPALHDEVAP